MSNDSTWKKEPYQPTIPYPFTMSRRRSVCGGRGHVSYGFYTGLTSSNQSVPQPEQCKTCWGKGVV